ncbi:hypothetical protein [Diaminobutyricibacter sp. McL0608]|uniref:baeRF11 domain-containing protein n=1 Tax=Leifsonia sp. McL0608 TaxID=3143537 RepID=UPI0031F309F7
MEYKDIPTRADIERIAAIREPGSVSIYLRSGPLPADADVARIELKNHLAQAIRDLEALKIPKAQIGAIAAEGEVIVENRDFWRYQSRSLAVFLNGDLSETFRLPNRLSSSCDVSDRFYIKPLLRTVTFPQSAYILALAQNSVRLVKISPEAPAEVVEVAGLPHDLTSFVGRTTIDDRSSAGRVRGSEGQKVRMLEYSQAIDRALRPMFANSTEPLIVAAAEPLLGIYRGVCDYPRLVETAITGNPEERSEEELAASARGILDEVYAAKTAELKDDFEARMAAGTATGDLSDIARAATYGAIETLVFDIDRRVPGTIDDETGVITFADDDEDETSNYGVIDEILRRSLTSKAKVFAVRAEDVPGGGASAAAVRFPI